MVGPSHRRGDPNVAVLLTWFLPGSGHFYLGRWVPGVLALILVEGLYAVGWFLSDGRTFEFLDPELRGPLATVLTPEVGNLGGLTAQMRYVGFGADEALPFPGRVELGGMLTALSGIANLFWMVHAHLEARTAPAALNPPLPASRPRPASSRAPRGASRSGSCSSPRASAGARARCSRARRSAPRRTRFEHRDLVDRQAYRRVLLARHEMKLSSSRRSALYR